jgi:hypothetical protein
MPTRLINRTDISEYRQISDSVNDKVLNPQIDDAQFLDVQKLLGERFYNDLIINSATTANAALLSGGVYNYNGITYTNHGLKAVIIRYAYARYILFGSFIDSPFSLVEKLSSQDSQAVSSTDKKNISKSNQQAAFVYWENVKLFLDRNAGDYPLWRNSCAAVSRGFRVSRVG